MKARIKETGEVVEVEYDDDDLYVVLGRHQYLYANEFDIVAPFVRRCGYINFQTEGYT